MDLDILGQSGMLRIDDFVLDWHGGFTCNDPTHQVGYLKRTGMQIPKEWHYQTTPSDKPQAVYLIEDFASIANAPTGKAAQQSIALAMQTQSLLDQFWQAVS